MRNPSTLRDSWRSWQCLQKIRDIHCSLGIVTSLAQFMSFKLCAFSEVAPSFGAGRLETSFIVVGRTFFTYLQLLSWRHAGNVVEDQCHLTVSSGVAGPEVAVVVAYVARNEDSRRFTHENKNPSSSWKWTLVLQPTRTLTEVHELGCSKQSIKTYLNIRVYYHVLEWL